MSLLQEYMEPCQLIEKQREPDGEGGFIVNWTDGAEFQAAVVCDNSIQTRTAEQQGVTNIYTVTCAKNTKLEFHDAFKRLRDGKIFRVTSDGDDVQTPDRASVQFSQVSAEEWSLPR